MSRFPPVAIVGRGCVLPDALSPSHFWKNLSENRCAIRQLPPARWGLPLGAALPSNRGGFVSSFEDVFDAETIAEVERPQDLDAAYHWLVYSGRKALAECGSRFAPARLGLIVGQNAYPTEGHAAFVRHHWSGVGPSDARNRFSSGLLFRLAASTLGAQAKCLAVDAACASSLYAIKLACDSLADGELDLVLAGGVQREDSLMMYQGMSSLRAISPSGQCKPFDWHGDGVVPAEGAVLFALKRLADAVRQGDRVLGVIRGIGLTNDGRDGAFLAPSAPAQARAMKLAFECSETDPRDVDHIECHATGTQRGDASELQAIRLGYGDARPTLGTLKANLGHALGASAAAGVLKVLAGFEAQALAPSPPVRAPSQGLLQSGLEVPSDVRAWDGDRIAAVSAFGFGGANGHLLLESAPRSSPLSSRAPPSHDTVVVVGVGVIAPGIRGLAAFAARLLAPAPADPPERRVRDIELGYDQLGVPPRDIQSALAQQTAFLAVAADAIEGIAPVARERVGTVVGLECDGVLARWALPFRAGSSAAVSGPVMTVAEALGSLPNLTASRVHLSRDFRGPAFAVSAEEFSGVNAMLLGIRAVQTRELDLAIVGAVDFSCEPAHEAAVAAVRGSDHRVADGAVAFALKRKADAEREGDPILAEVTLAAPSGARDGGHATGIREAVEARFGFPLAAMGAFEVAAGVVVAATGARIDSRGGWSTLGSEAAFVESDPSARSAVRLRISDGSARIAVPHPLVAYLYAAPDRRALAEALEAGREGRDGACRLAIVAPSCESAQAPRASALARLKNGSGPTGPGIVFADGPVHGEVAFVFGAAGAAYRGVARELLLAFPDIAAELGARVQDAKVLADALTAPGEVRLQPFEHLAAGALTAQAHVLFSDVVKLRPGAALGLSAGEASALAALGAYDDGWAILGELRDSGLFGDQLTGACRAAGAYLGRSDGTCTDWRTFRVLAAADLVQAALAGAPDVFLTMVLAPEDCVIAGPEAACARVIERLGNSRVFPTGFDMVVHGPALGPVRDTWRRVHRRKVRPVTGVRFYTHAGSRAYELSEEACADALTAQALGPVDFAATTRRAYADGVRVYIEHGPRAAMTSAIHRILKGKPHVAVALDRRVGGGLPALCESVLELWAHGVSVDVDGFLGRVTGGQGRWAPPPRSLSLPAHPPDEPRWPPTTPASGA